MAGLLLGLMIGLVTGVIVGMAFSFPLGSAFGILIDRNLNGWAIEIEVILLIVCAFIIMKQFNIKWKRS